MQTVIFYDTKPFEREFFEKELSEQYNLVFKDSELTPDRVLSDVESNV